MQLACVALSLAACFALPVRAADTYVLDVIHSVPVFEFTHLGLSTQSGRFDKVDGNIVLDRAGRSGIVEFNIDASSLNMGYGTATPDSPGFKLLRVHEFSKIKFKSEQLYFDDQLRVVAATGNLTLLGVTRPLTIWVSRFACSISPTFKAEMCTGNITATVKRSEFGMLAFIPAISDEIRVIVPIETYKQAPAQD
jgi:polyisoprenoid-binding protein YceI